MSWLSELTSKAENLLNKIDQTAATSFHADHSEIDVQPQQRIGEINIPKEVTSNYQPQSPTVGKLSAKSLFETKPNKPTSKEIPISNASKVIGALQKSGSVRSTSTPSIKKQDDMLFEFLNSNNPPPAKGHTRNLSGPRTSTPRKSIDLTKASSMESLPTNSADLKSDSNKDNENQKRREDEPMKSPSPQPVENEMTEIKASSIDNIASNSQVSENISTENDNRISNLELENKLLKTEMHSLNEELASTLNKLKDHQEEAEKYKKRYENRRNQQNEDYDRIRKQYEDREADFNEALKAKDSQLAVLRIRIDDVDSKLMEKTKLLEQLQEENERITKDHCDASGLQNVTLDNLKMKLQDLENKLRLSLQEKEELKTELMTTKNQLLSEQEQYTENIRLLQSKQHEEKDKYRDYDVKLKNSQDIQENIQRELADYKEKAGRILQAKEKLIASLKQGASTTELSPLLMSELEEAKQERDMLKEDLQKKKYKLEQLQADFNDLELVHNNESDDYREKVDSLENAIQNEIMKRRNAEEDMRRYMEELNFSRDDLQKVRKAQISQNQQYESDIKRLQQQLSVKKQGSSSHEELENRIRTLTDSLIQKQTMVEALSTEKNSLVLQLERLERQYRDIQNSLIKRKAENQSDDLEDPGSGSRLQPMASIMPLQITRNQRWKKTVNDIDKFSVRLGVFLRRYPVARLMVIAYMLLLHLWVTFVLLTYTPEIHNHEFTDKGPR